MTTDEFPEFAAKTTAGYAEDMELHGGQTRAAAVKRADDDMAAVLPQRMATPGHHFFMVQARGAAVGQLWLAERSIGGRRVLFIYDIAIEEEQRGRGYGRAAMELAEGEARARGLGRIELNVFGGNEVARGLYRSLGYVETAVQMAKDLG